MPRLADVRSIRPSGSYVQHARQREIGDELAAAGQQPMILAAPKWGRRLRFRRRGTLLGGIAGLALCLRRRDRGFHDLGEAAEHVLKEWADAWGAI
jgi:hypothetical protein